MAETIGVDQGELNREINNTSGSVNNINPLEYGSDIGADRFERLKELHDETVELTNLFGFLVLQDLRRIQGVGVNIADTDGAMARSLSGMRNTGGD